MGPRYAKYPASVLGDQKRPFNAAFSGFQLLRDTFAARPKETDMSETTINRSDPDIRTALATAEAEAAAAARVVYLLQWSGARFNKAIRAIQADCPPDIASRIEKAFGDNAKPPEAEWAEAAELRAEVGRWKTAHCVAVDHDLTDVEAEAALQSEGIFVWGPDGERFERMFAVVMKMRAADPDAETGCADDRSPLGSAVAALTGGTPHE